MIERIKNFMARNKYIIISLIALYIAFTILLILLSSLEDTPFEYQVF